jgi:hypothetical protein
VDSSNSFLTNLTAAAVQLLATLKMSNQKLLHFSSHSLNEELHNLYA